MTSATVLKYMAEYTQDELARSRGHRSWRQLFRR